MYKQRASSAGLLLTKGQATGKGRLKLGTLGATIQTHILETFARKEYSVKLPDTKFKQTLKGTLGENEAIELLDEAHPIKDFRVKNKTRYFTDEFSGEPDLILPFDKMITDIKCPYNFLTFLKSPTTLDELKSVKWEYYMQLLTYRELMRVNGIEINKLCVAYCAIDTKIDILERFEYKSLSYEYGYDTDEYHEAVEELVNLHTFSDKLTPQQRIKRIEWDFDEQCEADTEKLKSQIPIAREYYNSLTI
jgi:hypothetical protein